MELFEQQYREFTIYVGEVTDFDDEFLHYCGYVVNDDRNLVGFSIGCWDAEKALGYAKEIADVRSQTVRA